MISLHLPYISAAIIALISIAFLQSASATVQYCSSINTSAQNANQSIYQSNGLCHDFCDDQSFAFAVVQYDDCWCSNFVPSVTASADECDTTCPGYPPDLCGGNDLFGYIPLDRAASGTRGANVASPTSASSTPATTPQAKTTSSSSSSSSSSTSSTMTWTPTPVVSVLTVTGQVQTITFTPTTPPNSSANQADLSKGGSGALSTGQAVGLTFGLVAVVALLAGIIFFCIRKRNKAKKREAEEAAGGIFSSRRGSSNRGPTPQRTMSENSRFMLQTDGRQVVEGWESDSGTPGSRVSRLLPVDPRLDPYARVYQRDDANKSRESVQTIQDNHDYSRRMVQQGPILRATNPD